MSSFNSSINDRPILGEILKRLGYHISSEVAKYSMRRNNAASDSALSSSDPYFKVISRLSWDYIMRDISSEQSRIRPSPSAISGQQAPSAILYILYCLFRPGVDLASFITVSGRFTIQPHSLHTIFQNGSHHQHRGPHGL